MVLVRRSHNAVPVRTRTTPYPWVGGVVASCSCIECEKVIRAPYRALGAPPETRRKFARDFLSAVRVSASAVLFILKVWHPRHYSRCDLATIRPPH
jgi:hypothetical protein